MLTATYYLKTNSDATCIWHYTCANSLWAETPTYVNRPVPLAAVKRTIAQHFAGLGPRWNKRIYVNGRRVNRRRFLEGIRLLT